MRVLIAGAGGQLGRALVDAAPPETVIIPLDHARLDISSFERVEQAMQEYCPDVVVNAAAFTAVDRAESEPENARRINVLGPRHLAIAASQIKARLIHVSTDFVFDGTSSVPYRPDSDTNPLNVYGMTKREGETEVLDLLPEHSVVLRTAWLYGAGGNNFVMRMLRMMKGCAPVRVVSDQIGTPTAVRSLAEVVLRIGARAGIRGVHHWTDAGIASWYDFAVAIAEEAAALKLLPRQVSVVPIAARQYPGSVRRPSFSVLDTSSLTVLGVERVHWRKQLRRVLQQIRAQ
jgi:dTDP-4-dehydrorhamnose reductase